MRKIDKERKTNETDIKLSFHLDGARKIKMDTKIPFLDHMLTLFAFFGSFDLEILATGDLEVDDHHLVEDVAILLGQAIKELLEKDKRIERFASNYVPMDESLSRVVIDCSNRPYLVFKSEFTNEKIGTLTTQNIKEFFKAFVNESRINLHIETLYGENDHHKAESIFKAFGKTLFDATRITSDTINSTKGVL